MIARSSDPKEAILKQSVIDESSGGEIQPEKVRLRLSMLERQYQCHWLIRRLKEPEAQIKLLGFLGNRMDQYSSDTENIGRGTRSLHRVEKQGCPQALSLHR